MEATETVGGIVDNDGWVDMWVKGDTGFHQTTHDE